MGWENPLGTKDEASFLTCMFRSGQSGTSFFLFQLDHPFDQLCFGKVSKKRRGGGQSILVTIWEESIFDDWGRAWRDQSRGFSYGVTERRRCIRGCRQWRSVLMIICHAIKCGQWMTFAAIVVLRGALCNTRVNGRLIGALFEWREIKTLNPQAFFLREYWLPWDNAAPVR